MNAREKVIPAFQLEDFDDPLRRPEAKTTPSQNSLCLSDDLYDKWMSRHSLSKNLIFQDTSGWDGVSISPEE